MANFKEIVTKAVIGKGKKTFVTNHSITPEVEPSTILGCWVINHNFKGYKTGNSINVEGSFDVNIWYSCMNDSKTEVIRQTTNYQENVIVPRKSESDISSNEEVIVRSLRQPSCVKAEIIDGNINYTIEKELGIEIVGDTKVKIAIDENEDPWEEIGENESQTTAENFTEEIEQAIEEQVEEEFLN